MKLTEEQRDQIKSSVHEWHNEVMQMAWLLDRIEQIVSERDTIKPYHEHGNSVASDRTEPGEPGHSAEEKKADEIAGFMYKFSDCDDEYTWLPSEKFNEVALLALQSMRLHASQVCADKDARIKELEGLLSSDSVYGLFRFAYKSPESAQVYEISKKLRELKTK